MKSETRYAYEKRIKSLQQDVNRLTIYRDICHDIHFNIAEMAQKGDVLNQIWILRQFRRAWK